MDYITTRYTDLDYSNASKHNDKTKILLKLL
jgi:hypothetical protein